MGFAVVGLVSFDNSGGYGTVVLRLEEILDSIMKQWQPSQRIVQLLVGGILLPIAALLIFATAKLLSLSGDDEGARWLKRASVLCCAAWVFDLICLVLLTAWRSAQSVQLESTKEDFENDDLGPPISDGE